MIYNGPRRPNAPPSPPGRLTHLLEALDRAFEPDGSDTSARRPAGRRDDTCVCDGKRAGVSGVRSGRR